MIRMCDIEYSIRVNYSVILIKNGFASLEGILEVGIRVDTLFECLVAVLLPLALLVAASHKGVVFLRAELARGNVFVILPERFTTKGASEDFDRLEAEPRSNLNQGQLLNVVDLSELFLMLVDYLVYSEPDTIVVEVEREDMVNEGLRLGVVLRGVKCLVQHFLNELEVRLGVERGVKGEEWSRELQTIACQLELI